MLEKEICQELNNCKSREETSTDSRQGELTWTNFHCALCLGVGGFILFWIFLLARMYLPMENALMAWWLGKPSPTEGPNIIEVTSEQSS